MGHPHALFNKVFAVDDEIAVFGGKDHSPLFGYRNLDGLPRL
jgi:hypothetical protein